MSNRQIMKKVFDEAFDKEKMRCQILLEYERKEKNKMNKYWKFALPVLVLAIMGVVVVFNNTKRINADIKGVTRYDGNIVINKLDNMGAFKFDADVKAISGDDKNREMLRDLKESVVIPKDLEKLDKYSIYGRKDKSSSYDILNCYVYDYYKSDGERNVRIAFSDKYKPMRDYDFDKKGAVKSVIKGQDVIIYQYEKIYFAEFSYKGYNFDIEASNISLEEFKTLLNSIIR